MEKKFGILVMVVLFLFMACGSRTQVKTDPASITKAKNLPEQYRPVIVEESHTRAPEWRSITFAEKKGRLIISGGDMGYYDYGLGVSTAKKIAMQNLIEAIGTRIRVKAGRSQTGDPKDRAAIETVTEDAIAMITDNIDMMGAWQKEIYYKKYLEGFRGAEDIKYDIFVLLEIKMSDYNMVKKIAFDKLMNRYKKRNNNGAKEILKDLYKKLEKEGPTEKI